MFRCKTCSEKDKRIVELKEQVEYLRSLVVPNNDPYQISYHTREADALLSGAVPEESEEDSTVDVAVLSERDKLLSGTY